MIGVLNSMGSFCPARHKLGYMLMIFDLCFGKDRQRVTIENQELEAVLVIGLNRTTQR